jgi:predicted ribosomally synthesized peptide with SipW-like signal peptide
MKKILGLTIAAILVIAMVAAGTFAYFSDQQASTGNVFTAGTLDLGLSSTGSTSATGDTSATFLSGANWKPGDTANGTLTVNNTGTIDMGHLTVAFSYPSVDVSGRPANITGSPWSLATDQFDKEITVTTATWGGVSQASLVGHSLFALNTAGAISLTPLTAGTTSDLVLVFTFATGATNGCQGNSLTLTVTLACTQN